MQCSLRDMALFVAAYEERSFTAAARRENTTQSGVSQHMRNLEQLLGVRLFLRERVGVTPTPAAGNFYRSCLRVLRTHADAHGEMARFRGGSAGQLRIGLMPTLTSAALAPALAAFMEDAPNVSVRVTEGYGTTLAAMVRAGALDFAIVPAQCDCVGIRARPFLRTPEALVSRGLRGVRPGEPVRLHDLDALDLMLPGAGNPRRRAIDAYCASGGIAVGHIQELDTVLGTLDFVARSDWMTILPAIVMAREQRRLSVNPIMDPPLMLDLALIEPARCRPPAHATHFVGLLRAEAQRLGEVAAPDPAPAPAMSGTA